MDGVIHARRRKSGERAGAMRVGMMRTRWAVEFGTDWQ